MIHSNHNLQWSNWLAEAAQILQEKQVTLMLFKLFAQLDVTKEIRENVLYKENDGLKIIVVNNYQQQVMQA